MATDAPQRSLDADNPNPTEAHDDQPKSLPIHVIETFRAGTRVALDRKMGMYRISLPPVPREVFDEVVLAKIRPMLEENRILKLNGAPDRNARFHRNDELKDYEMRYRFINRDDGGQPVLDDAGKNTYVKYHDSAHRIAREIAAKADDLLSEKLGIKPKEAAINF